MLAYADFRSGNKIQFSQIFKPSSVHVLSASILIGVGEFHINLISSDWKSHNPLPSEKNSNSMASRKVIVEFSESFNAKMDTELMYGNQRQ